MLEDGHTYDEADARSDLERVHNVYRDTLNAVVASAAKNHVMMSKHELEVAMEGVGEALANDADRPLEHLPNESYLPADAETLIEKAHGSLVDALRVKAIDWKGAFETIFGSPFRPQPSRGCGPTNPATPAVKDQL